MLDIITVLLSLSLFPFSQSFMLSQAYIQPPITTASESLQRLNGQRLGGNSQVEEKADCDGRFCRRAKGCPLALSWSGEHTNNLL